MIDNLAIQPGDQASINHTKTHNSPTIQFFKSRDTCLLLSVRAAVTPQILCGNLLAIAIKCLVVRQQMRPLLLKPSRFQANKPARAIGVFVRQQYILFEPCLVCSDDLATQWCRERSDPLGALDSRGALTTLQLATCSLETYMHKLTALSLRR